MCVAQHPLRRTKGFAATLATFLVVSLLSACGNQPLHTAPGESSAPTPAAAAAPARLGTQWGEGRESRVRTVEAKRLNPDQPDAVASIAYRDVAALRRALKPNAEQRLNLQLVQGDIEWAIHDENNRPKPLYRSRQGAEEFQLGGSQGERYTLVFRNLSNHHYLIIATVDGLDVLNGQPGSLRNGGYILNAYSTLVIEGFRKSSDEVAAFRFAAPERSYAANTPSGDVRNIGVIGAAVFRLDIPDAPLKSKAGQPNAFPGDADQGYAPPPRYKN